MDNNMNNGNGNGNASEKDKANLTTIWVLCGIVLAVGLGFLWFLFE